MLHEKRRNHEIRLREEHVAKYYDDNTKLFLKLGSARASRSIHQPLFLNAYDTHENAIHAQHNFILARIHDAGGSVNVLDLGCGVGSSMQYLADHTDDGVLFTGITLSSKQYTTGTRLIEDLGYSHRISLLQGSFQELPRDIGAFDLAYGIESFLHSPDAGIFFSEVRGALKPGGQLILFDDFLSRVPETRRETKILLDLQVHYKAYSLFRPAILQSLARDKGFTLEEYVDYTRGLRLSPWRRFWVRQMSPLARMLASRSAYAAFLVGGNARQRALRCGLLQYSMQRWRVGDYK